MARYAHLPEVVVKALPRLSDRAVKVAVALAVYANGDGECWPSRASICETIGTSRAKTVSKAVRELEAEGVLKVVRKRGKASRFFWADAKPGAESAPAVGTLSAPTQREVGALSAPRVGALSAPRLGALSAPLNIPIEHTHRTYDDGAGGNENGNGEEWPPRMLRHCPNFAADERLRAGWEKKLGHWRKVYGRSPHNLDIAAIVQDCHDYEMEKGKAYTDRLRFIGNRIREIANNPRFKDSFRINNPMED